MSPSQMIHINGENSVEITKGTHCTNFTMDSTDQTYNNHSNLSDPSLSVKSSTDLKKFTSSLKICRTISMTQEKVSFAPELCDASKLSRPPISHRRVKSMTSCQSIRGKNSRSISSEYLSFTEYQLDDLLECMKLRQSLHGEDHPEVAFIHNSIGNVHSKKGENNQAMKSYVEALRIYRTEYGDYHPSVASTLQNIGNAHYRLGREDLAIQCIEQALLIRGRVDGNEHTDMADTMQNLGQLYALCGNYEKAMDNFQKALDVRIRKQEEESQDGRGDDDNNNINIARIMNAMGNVYVATGNLEKARKMQEESLEIKRLVLGKSHASVAISLMDLGSVCHKLGNLDEAINHYKEALSIQRENNYHPGRYIDLGVTSNFIGCLYKEKGDILKSRKVLTNALSYYKKSSLSSSHPCIVALEADLESLLGQ